MPTSGYAVQWAYGMGIGHPKIYRKAKVVKEYVSDLFAEFLLPTLDKSVEFNRTLDQNLDYVADGEATSYAIKEALDRRQVWEAYDLHHDFLKRYDDRWTFPAWVKLGTVIVDTEEKDGPRNRKPVMPLTNMPPIMQYDPGEGLVMSPGEDVNEEMMKLIERMRLESQSRPPFEMEGYDLGVFNPYKVQWAYAKEIGSPSIHRDEEMAKGEVTHLLGNWIMKNLDSYWRQIVSRRGGHEEFVNSARLLVPQVLQLLEQGNVWGAYELWQEFYDRYEFEFGFPLFVAIGTVLVETRAPGGPARHRPLMRRGTKSPIEEHMKAGKSDITIVAMREEHEAMAAVQDLMQSAMEEVEKRGIKITIEEFDNLLQAVVSDIEKQRKQVTSEEEARNFMDAVKEELLRRIRGLSMGYNLSAIQSWLVQYADFGGAWHPGHHTNEARAKEQARGYLQRLLHSLDMHLSAEESARGGTPYVREGEAVLHHVQYLLDNNMIWAAYLDFKKFQEDWNYSRGPIPLEMAMGTMRVIPEPEPEA